MTKQTHIWIHCPYVGGYIRQEGVLDEDTLVFEYTQRTWMSFNTNRKTQIKFDDYEEYNTSHLEPTDTAKVPHFFRRIVKAWRRLAHYNQEIIAFIIFISFLATLFCLTVLLHK